MLQARQLGIPVVAPYHTDLPGFLRRWRLPFLAPSVQAILRWIHNQADLNLTPSEATRQTLEAVGFERLGVWPHGVDAVRFHPKHREPAWRTWLTQGHDEWPLLLYVGRLSPEKQIERLRPLLDHLPRVRLAIVGDGPARCKLESYLPGHQRYSRGICAAATWPKPTPPPIYLFPRPPTKPLVALFPKRWPRVCQW
ncbi:MAG: glycosyltransferase [Chloroflexi bacterium]|nr:glycosyltransferase [Chloroflexota bacterium]